MGGGLAHVEARRRISDQGGAACLAASMYRSLTRRRSGRSSPYSFSSGSWRSHRPPARPPPAETSVGNIVEFDQNVTVPAGTTADSVVVFGGSATIAGTVRETVVGIGADVTLQPSARVGTADGASDTSVVVLGGTLTSAPGATVVGDTTYEPLSAVRDGISSGFWEPISTPFAGLSLIGWAGSTVLLVLLGLLVAAVLPRQTRASQERIAGHFWSSLGWGALTAIVIVPLVTLALVVDHRRDPRGDPMGVRRRGRSSSSATSRSGRSSAGRCCAWWATGVTT